MKAKPSDPEQVLLSSLFDADKIVASWVQPADEAAVDSMLHWRGSPSARCAHLRASLFPSISHQPKNLVELLRHAGMKELIQPISWAMRTLARRARTRPGRRVVNVPVDRVLSNIWMTVRVANIFTQNARGTQPPPVDLSRVRFKDEDFYIVEDGNHRCETAKMLGEKTIRAEISEDRHFVPSDWTITQHGFRHNRTAREADAAKDLRAAARWLGVPMDRDLLPKKSSGRRKA